MNLRYIALGMALLVTSGMAKADLVLDKVIIDLEAQELGRDDIELVNEGSDRLYVAVEPAEIIFPDTVGEKRVELTLEDENPLFVSPRRLILEPGERRLVRIAYVGTAPQTERTFRVRIRPVSGTVDGEESGLKLLIGYDTLVLLRPFRRTGELHIHRDDDKVRVRNDSNSSYEFFDGKACRPDRVTCRDLRPNRLYPREEWEIGATADESVEFTRIIDGRAQKIAF